VAASNEEAVAAMSGLATDIGAEARPSLSLPAKLRAYYELAKPNIVMLVVITGIIGFCLASSNAIATDWWRFVHLVFGMAFTASGACALNMVIERDLDRAMRRTRMRPIPSGRIAARPALAFSLAIFAIGFAELWLFTGAYPAVLSLVTLAIYALLYTPMKRKGPISIWIGAVPGAIPPVMGWSCVRHEIGVGGLVLFAILFLWQFPHFLALAWMYRDDYARAGFRFLPEGDLDGRRTGRSIAFGAAVLLIASLLPWGVHLTGLVYLVGASIAGFAFLIVCVRVAERSTLPNARSAFLASVTYLPTLLALMLVDRAL
jgi:heme o synthase